MKNLYFFSCENLISYGLETIIKHNQSNEVEVANCDSKRCSKHKLIYDLTMPQIVSLIQRSSECRQFIKVIFSKSNELQCLFSLFKTNNKPKNKIYKTNDVRNN